MQSLNRGDEALPLLKKSVSQYPDDKRLGLTYARTLVEQNRMTEAKVQFASLVEQYPEDDELRFSLALVCLGPVPAFYDEPMLQQERWAQRMPLADVVFENGWGQLETRQPPEGGTASET